MYIDGNNPVLAEVLDAYTLPSTVLGAVRSGQGHINETYCVVCQPQEGDCIRFILQGLSQAAFPHPEELMENFVGITSYLREKVTAAGGDPMRETLSLVKTRDGKDFYTDKNGNPNTWYEIVADRVSFTGEKSQGGSYGDSYGAPAPSAPPQYNAAPAAPAAPVSDFSAAESDDDYPF